MRTHEYRCSACGCHHSHDHDANDGKGAVPVCRTKDCPGKLEVEKFGFACKGCGKLIHAQHAGEQKVPHSCPNCGRGIHIGFDAGRHHEIMESMIPKGKALTSKEITEISKKIHEQIAALPTERKHFPDNFVVLADLPETAPNGEPCLKDHGLTKAQVEKWTPIPATPKTRPPQNIIRGGREDMVPADAGVGVVQKG